MTSYERVYAAIHHQPTDRLPCSFLAEDIIWKRLLAHFGLTDREALLDLLDVDTRSIGPRYVGPPLITDENGYTETVVSGGPRVTKLYNEVGDYTTAIAYFPWADVESPEDVVGRTGWDGREEWWDYSHVEEDIDRINAVQPRWIRAHGDPSGLQHITMWAGDEKFLCDLAADEELAEAMIKEANKGRLEHALKTLEAGHGKIHELDGGGDYGTQNGLLISRPMFRKYFYQLYVDFYKEIRKNFDVEIFFHSCGAVSELIGDLVEAGVTILDPVQVSARGMEPAGLKAKWGDRLTFHGGIDVQTVLPHGTPADVAEAVRHMQATLGKDGGYILAPSHNIQFDTSIENILTMYETAQGRRIRP